MSNRGNQDKRKYCDRESPDDRKYAELEKLAEQYKRWNYSTKETPRISRESVEQFAPTYLTIQYRKNETTQSKEPEQNGTKEDVRVEMNETKRSTSKNKFFDKLSMFGCMLPMVLGGLIPVVLGIVGIWNVSEGNVGVFLLNTIAIPFAILGFTNMVRGFFKVMEDDEINLGLNKYWKYVLYFVTNIVGYVAIGLTIMQIMNF